MDTLPTRQNPPVHSGTSSQCSCSWQRCPLGNRPLQCTERWGWVRVYTTWGTTDPDDIGFETGCLRDDADLPDGENLLLLQSRPETVHSNGAPQKPAAPAPQPVAAGAGGFNLGSLTSTILAAR